MTRKQAMHFAKLARLNLERAVARADREHAAAVKARAERDEARQEVARLRKLLGADGQAKATADEVVKALVAKMQKVLR